MKILITGSAGFIGSNFINIAHQKGHKITALRRKNSKTSVKIDKEPTWVYGDLKTFDQSYLNSNDIFIHLASHSANVPYDTLAKCIDWNVTSSLNIIK